MDKVLAYQWSTYWPSNSCLMSVLTSVCRWYLSFAEHGRFGSRKTWTNYWRQIRLMVVKLLAPEHIYIYIYIYMRRRVISSSTFGPFRQLLSLFCENLILTAARSKLKAINLATGELLVCPPFWVDVWPPKVDKLITFEVAKLITFKWLYVSHIWDYLGHIFWKTEP